MVFLTPCIKLSGERFPFFDNKGFALPVVLGICMIVILITTGITARTRTRIGMASELENRAQAFCKLRSGYSTVLYNILTSYFLPYSINIYETDGQTREWNLYGNPIGLGQDTQMILRDTAGMIPLFYSQSLLEKLVLQASKDSGRALAFSDAFWDWQDTDQLKRINGAESWEYRANGYKYGPRNFYIQVPEEMGLIFGFDSDIYKKIINSITYASGGSKNYLTMDRLTLDALIPSEALVDTIIQMRKNKTLTGANFTQMTGISSSLSVAFFPSKKIQIHIKAVHGNSVATLRAVIEKEENQTGPVKVLEWRK